MLVDLAIQYLDTIIFGVATMLAIVVGFLDSKKQNTKNAIRMTKTVQDRVAKDFGKLNEEFIEEIRLRVIETKEKAISLAHPKYVRERYEKKFQKLFLKYKDLLEREDVELIEALITEGEENEDF